ncbi:MAG: GWxTD domain-containing protein [Calditrichia bacterium]
MITVKQIIFHPIRSLLLICGIALLAVPHSGKSQSAQNLHDWDFPARSSGNLDFYADVCQFQGRNGRVRVEVNYVFNVWQLASDGQERRQSGELNVTAFILNRAGDTLQVRTEQREFTPGEMQKDNNFAFVNKTVFLLQPDTVLLKLKLASADGQLTGEISHPIAVRSFENGFSLSDLCFLSSLQKAEGDSSIFVKHNLLMLPNPNRVYQVDSVKHRAYVYFGLNNLDYDPENPSYYQSRFTVSDMLGKVRIKKSSDPVMKSAAGVARVEVFSLDSLSSALYKFSVTATDLNSEVSVKRDRYFWVVSDKPAEDVLLPMSDADVEKYYDQIRYIATHAEKKIYRELDKKGKQQFLIKFWQKRDPDPTTPENEFMEQHFRRIAYAEEHFTNGINSDRGRILIQYGEPVEVTRTPSFKGFAKPVEIWTYSLEGRTEFYFVDRNRDGTYTLVNSTHRDEINNPDWMEEAY